ncbi:hypothetical protein PENTCL1PPCAC_19387, partial [Pristionchus entomophagus]
LLISSFSFTVSIRIGHLQSSPEERDVILSCFPPNNSSVKVVSLPACDSLFSGVDNAAKFRYFHRMEAFIGANCVEEAMAISRLTERWSSPY